MEHRQGGKRPVQPLVFVARPTAAQAHDPGCRPQQGLGRGATGEDQNLGRDQLDLPFDEGQAGGGLAEVSAGVGVRLPGGRQNSRLVI
jgi:hypothetical protein